MESSFSEYRDRTGVDDDSEEDIIDNSLVADESFGVKKTPGKKNRTVFVPESEESEDDIAEQEVPAKSMLKIAIRKSSFAASHVASDSDSVKYNIPTEEVSPEIVPKRRPPMKPKSSDVSDTSIIGRRKNKRMMLLESDTENSIIIEHEKHKKLTCLKDTPIKIDAGIAKVTRNISNLSVDEICQSDSDEGDASMHQNGDDDQSDDVDDTDDDDEKQVDNKTKKVQAKNVIQSDDDHTEDDSDNKKVDVNKTKKQAKIIRDDDSNSCPSDDTENYYENDDNILNETDDNKLSKTKTETRSSLEHDNCYVKSDSKTKSKSQSDNSNKSETEDGSRRSFDNDHCYTTNKKPPAKCQSDKNDQTHTGNESNQGDSNVGDGDQSEGDDGLEDQLMMSRATRMSIMGVVPKGGDSSDDSDFIVSDKSRSSSSASNSLPDISSYMQKTPKAKPKTEPNRDTSTLSCSPFSSPLHDITNEGSFKVPRLKNPKAGEKPRNLPQGKTKRNPVDEDVTFVDEYTDDSRVSSKENSRVSKTYSRASQKVQVIDDDVTVIDTKPEVIALSSDDDEPEPPKQPTKRSPVTKNDQTAQENTLKKYLQPASYPNQIVYVKKHVLENELSKLEELRQDLHHLKYMMDNMDMRSLPDGGKKLIERLSTLERQVRIQGDKVATFIIEPDNPTTTQMANDGFEPAKPSWEELQKGSQAVQPRMFGKQAMATHMSERNEILDRLQDLHKSLDSRPSEGTLATQPAAVRATLMPHQLHALAWLRWRETQRPCGGILADDMGLGKTITMISLLVSDKDKIDNDDDDDDLDDDSRARSKLARGGTLVVCPASLIQQWAGEVKKHCVPHSASVCLHHGANRATHPHRLATNDMVVTTYNILQRDKEKNGVLMKIVWRRIILDEAHIVRNHKSATSQAVSALKGQRRWCLTGTPVHNKDLDLFALLKFLRCTPFDELPMWKKWIDNKSSGGQERQGTIMRCILLRRTKAQLQQKGQLACLPTRDTHHIEVTLEKNEMNVYQKVLVFSASLFAQFLHQRAEKQGDAGAGNDAYYKMHKKMVALQGARPVKSHEILVLLLRLRQICCHCGLIASMLDEETADAPEDPAGQDLLSELNKLSLDDSRRQSKNHGEPETEEPVESTTVREAIKSILSPNNPVFKLTNQSSKIRAVIDCLRQNVFVNQGEKAVVVSQWTSVLRLVETELKQERIRSVTLSGEVAVPARAPLIDALNDPRSDVRVMLLSLCAGGVGLNLCGANHLLLLDPHWNPQLEEQAQDRIYRVGQTKPVHIYRFMCVDTVEQKIRKLQEDKLQLAENVLTGAKHTNASKLTIEDLKSLFNMGQNAPVPTM